MTHLRPMLAVRDLRRTMSFYCDQLGFTCGDTFGDPPVWCSLYRDGVELMFNQPPDLEQDVPRRSRDYQVYYVNADDVVALRAELVGRGVACSPLRVTAYGTKEFEVRDPDDIWLWFGEETTEAPTSGE